VQGVAAAPSRAQLAPDAFVVENANEAHVDVVGFAGVELMLTDGVATTVQANAADAVSEPEAAVTEKVCVPAVRPV
jgi:hypothetical protein